LTVFDDNVVNTNWTKSDSRQW